MRQLIVTCRLGDDGNPPGAKPEKLFEAQTLNSPNGITIDDRGRIYVRPAVPAGAKARGGGRAVRGGHLPADARCFSLVLAGGGLKTGQAIGTSDELAMKPAEDPVSLPDFHATIHAALGTDPAEELYDGARPVPLTDGGRPIAKLFPTA